jgi:hypothetical protein
MALFIKLRGVWFSSVDVAIKIQSTEEEINYLTSTGG